MFLSFIIQIAFMALWAYFASDAYRKLKAYNQFRSSRLKGGLVDTVKHNPRESLILFIGVLLAIQFVYMIGSVL